MRANGSSRYYSTMSKHIWIINEYAGSPYHGMEFRHYYLGKALIKLGYRVTIISSSYSHLFKDLPKTKSETIDGIDYRWIQTIDYGNSHNKKRALKWLLFTIKCFALPFVIKKPDTIIVSPMAPFVIFPSWIVAKIYRAKLIYEVKDIWPLSLIELGGFSPKHPFIRLMSLFEKFALKKSDAVVSNLQNYGEHLQELGIERNFEWISNGIDIEELQKYEPLAEVTLKRIPKNKFVIGYTGTVGVANTLQSFCQAAKLLQNRSDMLFVIVGEGQEKERLLQTYGNLENLIFIDAIAKTQIQSMLALFDVCYIGLKKERLFRFGVSPNKLFDYMFSATPILYAIDSGKTNIVKEARCGICVEAENPQSIAEGIETMFNLSQDERNRMGINAKRYVLSNFTYENLAQKYHELIERGHER